jgi:hypothetical protein
MKEHQGLQGPSRIQEIGPDDLNRNAWIVARQKKAGLSYD